MKLGLSSYTFGWAVSMRAHIPVRTLVEHGLLDQWREHDVKLLQIGDNLPLHDFTTTRLTLLAERAARDGVRLKVGARGLTIQRVSHT